VRAVLRDTSELEVNGGVVAGARGRHLSLDEVQALSARLEHAALRAREPDPMPKGISMSHTVEPRSAPGAVTATGGARSKPTVAMFVALYAELQVLARRWKLEHEYGDRLWRGSVAGADVLVYSPRAMGRVEAALETAEVLNSLPAAPDMIIVAGLAGGFPQRGVRMGGIIVADSVVDLAARKVTEEQGAARSSFRPREFALDQRIRDYLQSGSFKRAEWLGRVAEQEEWPDGLRPVIHHGHICSGDEVVASGDWVDRLLSAWPLLLGVEMEAGGVCAAAERLQRRVAVLRVVSDFADPAKADDEWRVRGMKTIASLLENLDFPSVCDAGARSERR
jgi:nucleoside phosphorylase